MSKEFSKEDMLDFIQYYDNKREEDCFDTYEEELEEFIQIRQTEIHLSSRQIELNKKAIETAIAVCDWDSYDKSKYNSPKEEITDSYWLIEKLTQYHINT